VIRAAVWPVALTLVPALVVACGGGDLGGEDGADTVLVLAAASLTDAFTDLAAAFESANDGVTVELAFGGSSTLAAQIVEGAPAAVFASASSAEMEQVVEAGLADDPSTFATNRLEIVTTPGSRVTVSGLGDFAREELLVGLCAEAVPCGTLARRALDAAGVVPSIDTNEPDVRALLAKVAAGELDLGIVYHSDVVAAGDGVVGIEIPANHNVIATYPIVTLGAASDRVAARAFVDFVLSADGGEILQRHGFGAP